VSPPASTPPSADATRGESLPITLFAVRVLLANKAREAVRRFDGTGMRDPGREVGLSGAGGGLGAGPTPSTHAVRREQAEAVLAAMSRLPAEYSDAIRRRAWDGATFADIGAATGRTEDAARMLFARALKRLERELDQDADATSG